MEILPIRDRWTSQHLPPWYIMNQVALTFPSDWSENTACAYPVRSHFGAQRVDDLKAERVNHMDFWVVAIANQSEIFGITELVRLETKINGESDTVIDHYNN